MIVDAFIFNNETDILRARLNYLEKYIDYFVIVESNNTFTGKSKKLILKEFLEKNFCHLQEKILIFENKTKIFTKNDLLIKKKDIFKKNSPSLKAILNIYNDTKINKGIALNETFQRELLKLAINKFIKNKNAIIVISDVDEIPNKNFLENLKNLKNDEIYYADMKQFIYSTSFRLMEKWIGSVALRKNLLDKFSIYYFRFMIKHEKKYLIPFKIIINSGWHLTSFGSISMIKDKISSWGHWELNTFINKKFLYYRIKRCFDIFGRNKKIIYLKNNEYLPQKISSIFTNKKYIKDFIEPNLLDFLFNSMLVYFDKFCTLIKIVSKRK